MWWQALHFVEYAFLAALYSTAAFMFSSSGSYHFIQFRNKLIPASLTLGAAGCVTLPDFAFAISNIEAKLS
jgi:hypothetical protein